MHSEWDKHVIQIRSLVASIQDIQSRAEILNDCEEGTPMYNLYKDIDNTLWDYVTEIKEDPDLKSLMTREEEEEASKSNDYGDAQDWVNFVESEYNHAIRL